MHYQYRTSGTCSTKIEFDLENNMLHNVVFFGGCNGNLKGIGKLVEGLDADKVVEMLRGTTCEYKSTSCPDQLAQAIIEAKSES